MMKNILPLIVAAGWQLGILLAAGGWGLLFCSLVRLQNLGPGLVSALGLALLGFIGGVLNIFGAITTSSLHILLLLGWLILFLAITRRPPSLRSAGKNRADALVFFTSAILLVIVFRGILAAAETNLNRVDDYQAYFSFSKKILETGSLGFDFFSQRRIVSSLGLKYFFDSLFLLHGNLSNLLALDLVLGLSLLVLLTRDVMRSLACPKGIIVLMLAAIALTPSLAVNSTADYLAAAMLCASMRMAGLSASDKTDDWRPWLALGLLFSACLCLRSTIAIPTVLIAVGTLVLTITYSPSMRLLFPWKAPILFFSSTIFALPWMLMMLPVAGTLFYPFLGKGFGYEYSISPMANIQGLSAANLLQTLYSLAHPNIFIPIILAGFCVIFHVSSKSWNRTCLTTLLLGAVPLASLMVLSFGTGGCDVERYIYPLTVAVTPLIIGAAWNMRQVATVWVACGLLFGTGYASMLSKSAVLDYFADITRRAQGWTLDTEEMRDAISEIQSATSAGETILVHTDHNYLFDFKRNNILIWDMPGAFGPMGGFPKEITPQSFAEYARSLGVRYIVYSYVTKAQFPDSMTAEWQGSKYYPWMRRYARKVHEYHELLKELMMSYNSTIQAQGLVLIDLASAAR